MYVRGHKLILGHQTDVHVIKNVLIDRFNTPAYLNNLAFQAVVGCDFVVVVLLKEFARGYPNNLGWGAGNYGSPQISTR